MTKSAAYNEVIFEDVSKSTLLIEDCLIELEPYGSFPGCEFRRSDYDNAMPTGGEI